MPILELTSKERSTLRSLAHSIKPVVQIGDNGLTPAVLKEIDRSLTAHSLIKVRVAGDDRDNRIAILQEICDTLSCARVTHLGKTLTLYRHSEQNPSLLASLKEPTERSKRLPNEEYTPKKLAAAGKTIRDKKKKSILKGNDDIVTNGQKKQAIVHKIARHRAKKSVKKHTGSSLTLRAGRRN